MACGLSQPLLWQVCFKQSLTHPSCGAAFLKYTDTFAYSRLAVNYVMFFFDRLTGAAGQAPCCPSALERLCLLAWNRSHYSDMDKLSELRV